MEKININPLDTTYLYGLDKYFNDFTKLYDLNILPRVLLLTGKKGSGKFTLCVHLLNYIFDRSNYDFENRKIINKTNINSKLKDNNFSNIVYLNNYEKKVKIDDIRSLKSSLLKSALNDKPRFIILDDVETFNHNSLNALLKIIEEPNSKNFFILINNKQTHMLETIRSRCMETSLFLKEKERTMIIEKLTVLNSIESILDYKKLDITPGDFIRYNNLCVINNIKLNTNYIIKLNNILSFYKKTKELDFIKLSIFFTEQYFQELILKSYQDKFIINDIKIKIIKIINNFVSYNLNINTVISQVTKNFNYGK